MVKFNRGASRTNLKCQIILKINNIWHFNNLNFVNMIISYIDIKMKIQMLNNFEKLEKFVTLIFLENFWTD